MVIRFKFQYFICILIFSVFISCKNKSKINNDYNVKKTDSIFTEEIARIDTSLEIPNFIINNRTGVKKLNIYNNNKYQNAVLRNDTLYIISRFDFNEYHFKIQKNLKYGFEYSFWRCTECDPLYSTIGNRLILNKNNFVIGDTIKGKFIVNHLGRMPCDTSHETWIYKDSCLFSFIIE